MAKKDFDDYYKKVYKQYLSMTELYDEFKKQCAEKMVSDSQLRNYEATLQPVKETFNFVRYIKYLLDKPVNNIQLNKNIKFTERQNKLFNSDQHSPEELQKQLDSCIDKVRGQMNNA